MPNPKVNYSWIPQAGQLAPFLLPLQVKEVLLHGNRGSGKRLADQSKILTNRGWIQVGEVTRDHQLVAPDGTYTNVLGIYKRATGPLYKVTCNDGASVVVDEEHNWSVSKNLISWEVRTTQEMIDSPGVWFLPLAKAPPGVEYTGVSPYEHREVTSIERVADGPGTCFEVDHPSHQFICEDFIVTHNTDCLLATFLRGVGRGWGANWRGLLLKRTVPELGPLAEKAKLMYTAADPKVRFTSHPYIKFVWPGGEMLTLRHMLDPDDYNDLHGSEFQWIGWEELTTHTTPEVYLRCMSLLRSSHPEASQWMQVFSTTNPGGPGNSWVKRRWKLPEKNNQIIYDDDASEEMARWVNDPLVNVQSRPRVALFLDVRNNHLFLKQNPTYLADLARQAPNEATRRAWIDGDWSITSGGIWDHLWDRRYHVVKPFPIPRSWKIDRSHDAGSSTPFAVLWYAESDGSDYIDSKGQWHSSVKGDIFVIYEYYGTNGNQNQGLKLPPQTISKNIIEMEMEWGIYQRVIPGPADNAIHTETIAGINVAAMMAEPVRLDDGRVVQGVQWTRSDKAAGARITGWNMIEQYLANAIPDPQAKSPRERPGLFMFDRCKYLVDQLHQTPRDEKNPEDIPKRGEYHLQDTLRYRILDSGRGMSQGPVVGLH